MTRNLGIVLVVLVLFGGLVVLRIVQEGGSGEKPGAGPEVEDPGLSPPEVPRPAPDPDPETMQEPAPESGLDPGVSRFKALWQEAQASAARAEALIASARKEEDSAAGKMMVEEALAEWDGVWSIIDRLDEAGFDIHRHEEEIVEWTKSHHECSQWMAK